MDLSWSSFVWSLHCSICFLWFRASGQGMPFKKSFSLPWKKYWPCKTCWNTTRHLLSSSFKWFFQFLRSSNLECIKQTLVPPAIVNSFPSSQWIALVHYFPLEANGGRFLSLLIAFRNTATCRHSKIKKTRLTTKQDFSREALSKQNIKDCLASLWCSSSWVPTE